MLRKLRDIAPPWSSPKPIPCQDPEHNPPSHIVLSPGEWEHTCPSCGHKLVFWVGGIFWGVDISQTTGPII